MSVRRFPNDCFTVTIVGDQTTGTALILSVGLWVKIVGGSVLDSSAVVLVLWTVGGVGLRLLKLAKLGDYSAQQTWIWRLGPGVVLGAFILLLLRMILPRDIFLALFVGVMMLEIVRLPKHLKYLLSFMPFPRRSGGQLFQVIGRTLTISLIFGFNFLKDWPWILPYMIGLGAVLLLWTVTSTKCWLTFLLLLVVSSITPTLAATLNQFQARLWWAHAPDIQYFEALSWSLVENGPLVEPISSGRDGVSALAYHHGAFFISGLMDLLVRGGTYEVLTGYLPIALMTVFFSSLSAVLLTPWQPRPYLPIGLGIPIGVATFVISTGPESYSNLFGGSALFSSIAVAGLLATRRRSWVGDATASLMLPATALAKSPFILGSLLILAFSSVSQGRKGLISVGIFTSSAIGLFAFLRYASPAGGDYFLDLFNPNSLYELADDSKRIRIVAVFGTLAPILPGFLAGLWMIWKPPHRTTRFLVMGVISMMVSSYLSRFVFGAHTDAAEALRYLWLPATFGNVVIVAFSLRDSRPLHSLSAKSSIPIIKTTIFTVALLCLMPRVVPDFDSGSTNAKLLRFLRTTEFAQLLASIMIAWVSALRIVAAHRQRPRRANSESKIFRSLVTSLVAVSVLVTSTNYIPKLAEGLREGRTGQTDSERMKWIATQETVEVARFLRQSTEPSSLIATTLCVYGQPECATDYSLAAYSHRRFLSLGGAYLLRRSPKLLVVQDAENSVVSSVNPLSETLEYWKRRGVNYAVLDLSLVTWLPKSDHALSGTSVFQNEGFVVLKFESQSPS